MLVIPLSVNAQLISDNSVTGRIWEDNNFNGVYDDGEGISDVRIVTIFPPSEDMGEYLTHVSGGEYKFTGLETGISYTVSYQDPWIDTPMLDPSSVSFIHKNGTKIINFGIGDIENVIPSTTTIDTVVEPVIQERVVLENTIVEYSQPTTVQVPTVEIITDKEVLDLRLRILQVLENIFRIVLG
tara:strand:+ start:59 stop:610 length:552 start_codon:yes stop_codon:yes gene_type:complete